MKNKEQKEEEVILLNIERHVGILVLIALLSALDFYYVYTLYLKISPWIFVAAIPGMVLGFQLLWLGLHPFAIVLEDRFEINQSFIHRKQRYFIDIKQVSPAKGNYFYITYHDDEVEKIGVFGIRPAHYQKMTEMLNQMSQEKTRSLV